MLGSPGARMGAVWRNTNMFCVPINITINEKPETLFGFACDNQVTDAGLPNKTDTGPSPVLQYDTKGSCINQCVSKCLNY